VTEPYTHWPGSTVGRAESVRACREILDGLYDDLPESAFYFVGGIDDVRTRAERPSA
jgi:F0F1-type ATP synthase beta subunit